MRFSLPQRVPTHFPSPGLNSLISLRSSSSRIRIARRRQRSRTTFPARPEHRLLAQEKPRVIVPFAPALAEACNAQALRFRRDFPPILTLIMAHAALHAHRRPADDRGRVVATREDYEANYPLVADVVAYGAAGKVDPRLREVTAAVASL